LADQLSKKKIRENNDGIKLRSIRIPRFDDDGDQVYFALSVAVLLLICIIIVGACFGLAYFLFRQISQKEQFMPGDEDEAKRIVPQLSREELEKIEREVGFVRKATTALPKQQVEEEEKEEA